MIKLIKRKLMVVALLCVWMLAAGCQGEPVSTPDAAQASPAPATNTAAPTPVPTPTPTPEPIPTPDPVAEELKGLTTEQKVGQLLVAGIEGVTPGSDAVSAIQDYQVGGVILFGRNVERAAQLAELTNSLKALNGDYVPLLLCVDEEGGRVSRMPSEVTDLPSAFQYGKRSGEDALLSGLGRTLGAMCKTFGLNVDFAPDMDVWSNPENTVIGDRSFSSDPAVAAQSAALVADGIASAGVIPVGKHFPGHGDTATDSHKELPVVDKSYEAWEETDAVPFQKAVDQGVSQLMVGHILMRQMDPDYPASLSYKIVTGLLREKMGYSGVVFTDDLTMGAISNTYGMGEAAVMALEAGCDGLLVCHREENLKAAYDALLEAVNSARIPMDRLDESVYRILALKRQYNLSNIPVPAPDVDALNAQIQSVLPG